MSPRPPGILGSSSHPDSPPSSARTCRPPCSAPGGPSCPPRPAAPDHKDDLFNMYIEEDIPYKYIYIYYISCIV